MKRPSSLFAIVALFLLFACAGSLRAQDDLQFNVPYTCRDGVTYVVHKCLTGPKGEMCYYQAEGQSERYKRRIEGGGDRRSLGTTSAHEQELQSMPY